MQQHTKAILILLPHSKKEETCWQHRLQIENPHSKENEETEKLITQQVKKRRPSSTPGLA